VNETTYVKIQHANNGYVLTFGDWPSGDKGAQTFIEENPTRAGDRVQSYLEALAKKAARPKAKKAERGAP
jgi:hypothetical protein